MTSGDTKDNMTVRSDIGAYGDDVQIVYDHFPKNGIQSTTVNFNAGIGFSASDGISSDFGIS